MRSEEAEFEMPEITLGDIIFWFPGGQTKEKAAAIVTSVGARSVNVGVFIPGSYNMDVKMGVRHWRDPVLKRMAEGPEHSGSWAHRDDSLQINPPELLGADVEGAEEPRRRGRPRKVPVEA